MSVLTLSANPSSSSTSSAQGQLGTFGGHLYIHTTSAADTSWLDLTSLLAISSTYVAKSQKVAGHALSGDVAISTEDLTPDTAGAGVVHTLVLLGSALDYVGHSGSAAKLAMSPELPDGARLLSAALHPMQALDGVGIDTAIWSLGEMPGVLGASADPESLVRNTDGMNVTDSGQVTGHAAPGRTVKTLGLTLSLPGATLAAATAGTVQVVVTYTLGQA